MNALIRSSRLEDMPTDSALPIGRSSLASGCIGASTNASSAVQNTIEHTRLAWRIRVFSLAVLTLAAMKPPIEQGAIDSVQPATSGRIIRAARRRRSKRERRIESLREAVKEPVIVPRGRPADAD